MKRLISLFLLLIIGQIVFAEEFADHPLVGRYPGSTIVHQEYSEYGEYTIAVAPEQTETLVGRVWMTMYDGPGDSSTFSLYSTYMDFLEQQGFTILANCPPGTCGDFSSDYTYGLAPFAYDENYGYSAALTHGSWDQVSFISAKRTDQGEPIYVSIAMTEGWRDYPQYKLDVVEIASNKATIISSGTRTEDKRTDATGETSGDTGSAAQTGGEPSRGADASAGIIPGIGSLRAKSGYGAFFHFDPVMAGGYTFYNLSGTYVSASVSGFRNYHGPFGQVTWFINPNFGFAADFMYVKCDEEFTIEDITYKKEAEMSLIRGGLVARMIGDAYPPTIELGFGGGISIVTFYRAVIDNANNVFLKAEDFYPVVSFSAEMTVPIFSALHFSGGLEYLFIPVEEFTLEHDGGTDYFYLFEQPNLGGFILRIGLVYEL